MSTLYINERYLKTGGSDAADGLTYATAWGTIDHALSTLSGLTGCYRLNICEGTYSPTATLNFDTTSDFFMMRGIPSDGAFPERCTKESS